MKNLKHLIKQTEPQIDQALITYIAKSIGVVSQHVADLMDSFNEAKYRDYDKNGNGFEPPIEGIYEFNNKEEITRYEVNIEEVRKQLAVRNGKNNDTNSWKGWFEGKIPLKEIKKIDPNKEIIKLNTGKSQYGGSGLGMIIAAAVTREYFIRHGKIKGINTTPLENTNLYYIAPDSEESKLDEYLRQFKVRTQWSNGIPTLIKPEGYKIGENHVVELGTSKIILSTPFNDFIGDQGEFEESLDAEVYKNDIHQIVLNSIKNPKLFRRCLDALNHEELKTFLAVTESTYRKNGSIVDKFLSKVDGFYENNEEVMTITRKDFHQGIEYILEKNPEAVICCTMGSKGAMIITKEEAYDLLSNNKNFNLHHSSKPSFGAAGDTALGGMMMCLNLGLPKEFALKWGDALAQYRIDHPGNQDYAKEFFEEIKNGEEHLSLDDYITGDSWRFQI